EIPTATSSLFFRVIAPSLYAAFSISRKAWYTFDLLRTSVACAFFRSREMSLSLSILLLLKIAPRAGGLPLKCRWAPEGLDRARVIASSGRRPADSASARALFPTVDPHGGNIEQLHLHAPVAEKRAADIRDPAAHLVGDKSPAR